MHPPDGRAAFYGDGMVVAAYREHPGSSTGTDKQKVVTEALSMILKVKYLYIPLINKHLKSWFVRYQNSSRTWWAFLNDLLEESTCFYTGRDPSSCFSFRSIFRSSDLRLHAGWD